MLGKRWELAVAAVAVVVVSIVPACSSTTDQGGVRPESVTDQVVPTTDPTGQPPSVDPPTTATAQPHATQLTANEECAARSTPFPMPDVRGMILDDVFFGSLTCFDALSATTPDGLDILDKLGGSGGVYRVVSQSPDPELPVDLSSRVSLQVTELEYTELSASDRLPCTWVSDAEVAAVVGRPVTSQALDYPGTVNPQCTYTYDAGQITLGLQSAGSFVVDAPTDFDAARSNDAVAVDLGDDALCTRSGYLVALLGDRLLRVSPIASGFGCDQAKAIAMTALPRLSS